MSDSLESQDKDGETLSPGMSEGKGLVGGGERGGKELGVADGLGHIICDRAAKCT